MSEFTYIFREKEVESVAIKLKACGGDADIGLGYSHFSKATETWQTTGLTFVIAKNQEICERKENTVGGWFIYSGSSARASPEADEG